MRLRGNGWADNDAPRKAPSMVGKLAKKSSAAIETARW